MNIQNEKLHIGGSHELLYAASGTDILYLRAPSNAPSAVSFLLCEKERFTVNSEYDHSLGSCVHTLSEQEKTVKIFERFDMESGMFIRRCDCSFPITFRVTVREYAKFLYCKPMRSTNDSYPSFCVYLPAGSVVDGYDPQENDSFICAAFCGNVIYEPDNGCVTFGVGISNMLICGGSEPNDLRKFVFSELTKLKSEKPTDISKISQKEPNPDEFINALISLSSKDGFVLSSPVQPNIDPITQYMCVRAFLHAGMDDRAAAIVDAYYRRYTDNGKIIWGEKGGMKKIRSACEGSITPALVILSALSLPAKLLSQDHITMLCELMKYQRSFLLHSMMPFNGNEPENEAKYLTYHGSAFATLLFIESGRTLFRRLQELGMEVSEIDERFVDEAFEGFHRNFIKEGTPLLNSPKRESAYRRPRFKFGYCENCAPKFAHPVPCWTERTHYGIYICPECAKNGSPERHPTFIDPALRRISYMTVLRSAMIGTSLYPRGLIRQIATSIISYPSNDVKSVKEATLLCYIARKYELDRALIDKADSLLFEDDRIVDPVKFSYGFPGDNEFRCLETIDAATYALMYMTYELHALPKKRTCRRKKPPNLSFFDDEEKIK